MTNHVPLPILRNLSKTGKGKAGNEQMHLREKELNNGECHPTVDIQSLTQNEEMEVLTIDLPCGKTLSVWFSCSVVSDPLWLHGLQHARLPCPSPTPEVTQTHVHWVSNAIQPSHPLSSPSPPAFNLSQHQGLFHWVGSLYQVAEEL